MLPWSLWARCTRVARHKRSPRTCWGPVPTVWTAPYCIFGGSRKQPTTMWCAPFRKSVSSSVTPFSSCSRRMLMRQGALLATAGRAPSPQEGAPEGMKHTLGFLRTFPRVSTDVARTGTSYLFAFDARYGYRAKYSRTHSRGHAVEAVRSETPAPPPPPPPTLIDPDGSKPGGAKDGTRPNRRSISRKFARLPGP